MYKRSKEENIWCKWKKLEIDDFLKSVLEGHSHAQTIYKGYTDTRPRKIRKPEQQVNSKRNAMKETRSKLKSKKTQIKGLTEEDYFWEKDGKSFLHLKLENLEKEFAVQRAKNEVKLKRMRERAAQMSIQKDAANQLKRKWVEHINIEKEQAFRLKNSISDLKDWKRVFDIINQSYKPKEIENSKSGEHPEELRTGILAQVVET